MTDPDAPAVPPPGPTQTRPQPATKFHFVNPNGIPIPDEAYFETRNQEPQYLQQELLWAEQQLAAFQKYVDTLRSLTGKNGDKPESVAGPPPSSPPNGIPLIQLPHPIQPPSSLQPPIPPPSEEPIFAKDPTGRHEYSSDEKVRFYMAFDAKDPAVHESVRAFCRRHNIHHSTARSWLRQRKELGAAAYGKTRRMSKKLGRPPKSSAAEEAEAEAEAD